VAGSEENNIFAFSKKGKLFSIFARFLLPDFKRISSGVSKKKAFKKK